MTVTHHQLTFSDTSDLRGVAGLHLVVRQRLESVRAQRPARRGQPAVASPPWPARRGRPHAHWPVGCGNHPLTRSWDPSHLLPSPPRLTEPSPRRACGTLCVTPAVYPLSLPARPRPAAARVRGSHRGRCAHCAPSQSLLPQAASRQLPVSDTLTTLGDGRVPAPHACMSQADEAVSDSQV